MTYDYKETPDEIIIEKGIATREMWKTYADGSHEYVTYEDLAQALELRDKLPIVVEGDWDHTVPLTEAAVAVGSIALKPCPEKKGLTGTYRLKKARLPPWLLERIHRHEELPVSLFSFVQMDGHQQRNILFDNLMILKDASPRCPIERCGVGVYDAEMPESKDPDSEPKHPKEPAKDAGKLKAPESSPLTTTPPPPEPIQNALPQEARIKELEAQLAKREAQITEVRQPLVDFLALRGYTAPELSALSLPTLQRMARDATRVTTEALPGQTPAPSATTPKTLAEARDAEHERFMAALAKKQAERFGKM
jgi:hypothetical protein